MKKIFKIVMKTDTNTFEEKDLCHFFQFKNAQAKWLYLEKNRLESIESDRYGDDEGEYNYDTIAHNTSYTIEEVEVQDGS